LKTQNTTRLETFGPITEFHWIKIVLQTNLLSSLIDSENVSVPKSISILQAVRGIHIHSATEYIGYIYINYVLNYN